MSFLSTARERAAVLILALAIAVAFALLPFIGGLFGAAVLYVIFARPYRWLSQSTGPRIAATSILIVALVIIAAPLAWIVAVVIAQAPDSLASVQRSPLLARMASLRFAGYDIGAEIARASGTIISWLSLRAVAFVGGATSAVLNLVIAFFGFYYLLRTGGRSWRAVRDYVPFSRHTADALGERFVSVTEATLLGTALVALIQGSLVGIAFRIVGLSDPAFWGMVTALASVLPVLGSAIVWLPATIVLLAEGRYGSAAVMLVLGAGVASNIDNLIRPFVYRRVSNIHPMITLVGAFAGVKYFGLLGLLLGPLGIAYLFELLRVYRDEYGDAREERTGVDTNVRMSVSESPPTIAGAR